MWLLAMMLNTSYIELRTHKLILLFMVLKFTCKLVMHVIKTAAQPIKLELS